MRNAYLVHRLRKYARKKFRRSDPQAVLYWRYWHRLYGGHALIWSQAHDR